jgi:T5SS/PEP-CTERM-associated repeat protein/autotransporter-associated beta strand protein
MNFSNLRKLFLVVLACAAATESTVVSTALGQTFVWDGGTRGTGTLWSEPFNWSPRAGAPPNSTNGTARFPGFSSVGATVTLAGGPFTVGKIVFGTLGSRVRLPLSTFQHGTLRVATEIDVLQPFNAANFASDSTVLFLGPAMTIDAVPGSLVTFAGTVSGSGNPLTLTKTGEWELALNGKTMVNQMVVNGGLLTSQNGSILDNQTVVNGGLLSLNGSTLGTQTLVVNAALTSQNGIISDEMGVVGGSAGQTGQVTLSGSNAKWQNQGSLLIGDAGSGTLRLDHGSIATAHLVEIGSKAGSSGMVTIIEATLATAGSERNTVPGEIDIGYDKGSIGTVNISHGLLRSTGALIIGRSGNGTLSIPGGGGTVEASEVDIGYDAGSTGVATFSPGTLNSTGDLIVGVRGNGTLFISSASDVHGLIGAFSGSSGAVTVGSGASWNNSGALYIGGTSAGPGGTGLLRINSRGSVSAAQTTIWNTGTLELGGQFTLQSPLTINGGTVRSVDNNLIPNSATLGAGGAILDSNNFLSTYSGNFTGPGGITKIGPGTITLTGTNTYSGDTVLDNGTLTVGTPEALGTGNVIVNGGILNSILGLGLGQAINVKGNYTQNSGGTLQLNVAGSSPGQYGFISAGGNASLNGQLQLVNAGFTPAGGDSLTVLKAGGQVTSKFAELGNPFAKNPTYNTIEIVYHEKAVDVRFLKLTAPTEFPPVATVGPPNGPVVVSTDDFASFAQTPNELAAGRLLNTVTMDPRAAKLISFLDNEPLPNLPGDLQKITPDGDLTAVYEIGFSGANIQKLNLEGRLDDIRHGSSGFSSNMAINRESISKLENSSALNGKSSKETLEPILQPTAENRWGLWTTGFGDFVSVEEDSNATGYNFTTGGVSLGVDYRVTDCLTFGVFGNYSHTWTDLQPGDIGVDSGRGGLYATYFNRGFSVGTFYLNGAIYGGYNSYDSRRPALAGVATGNTDGGEFSTFVSGGYDFHLGQLTVGPIGSLQYTNVYLNGFSEQGSLAPLQIHSDSEESLRTDLGLRAFYRLKIGGHVVEPSIKATWEHEFKYSAIPITAGFAEIPGPSATFVGPKEGQDSAILSAGFSIQWSPKILTYVDYDGQLGRTRYDSNAVTGGVSISF